MTLHDDLCELAARQYGVVSVEQARRAGGSRSMLEGLRTGRQWDAGPGRILSRRGTPASTGRTLMAAVLDVGTTAFLSHTSAAAWWGLPGFSIVSHPTVHVSVSRGGTRRRSPLAVTHLVRDLGAGHVMRLNGIPTSSPARTVFELASIVSVGRGERVCDNALAMGLTSVRALHQMLDDWADHGRGGTVAMRAILDDRPLGYEPPASNLEARFRHLAQQYLVGPFRRQVNVGDAEGWIGRVDFRHEREPLVVEVQSQRYHSALSDQRADASRFASLESAGFVVVQVWDDELWNAPAPAMERVFQGLLRARKLAA